MMDDRDNFLLQLKLHQEWVSSLGERGKQLCLEDDNLSEVDLSRTNLCEVVIPGVILDNAN